MTGLLIGISLMLMVAAAFCWHVAEIALMQLMVGAALWLMLAAIAAAITGQPTGDDNSAK